MIKDDFENNIYWQMIGVLMSAKRKLVPIMDSNSITGIQAYILILLSSKAGKPMSFLAERLHCDASNITSLIDKLELLELIERRADTADRRIKLLFLTRKGNSVCKQLIADLSELEALSLSAGNLSKPAALDAIRLLQKLI